MENQFKHVTVISRQNRPGLLETLKILVDFLKSKKLDISIGPVSAELLKNSPYPVVDYADIGKDADLVIVIGGDGSLLRAAKSAAKHDTPVLGINRGTLGFLSDINPDEIMEKVDEVLEGKYQEESRYFLDMYLHEKGDVVSSGLALNDVVLLPGKEAAQMIEFDVYINKEFVCHQRADGLIVATPTGSTAYSLSGGGPIIKPDLEANVIVPMFPHTLSMRPIVVNANNRIKVTIGNDVETSPHVSCDGEAPIAIPPVGHLHIDKSKLRLRLLHPEDYQYFHRLRSKLHWGEKLC